MLEELQGFVNSERDVQPPTTPKELLERALVMARDEQRWITGTWMRLDWDTLDDEATVQVNHRDYSGITCKNAQACAMGILVLSTYDGPLVRAFVAGRLESSFEAICSTNPLIAIAGPILAYAFAKVRGVGSRTLEDYLEYPADATERVVSLNDSYPNSAMTVDAFTLAVEIAEERGYNQPVT